MNFNSLYLKFILLAYNNLNTGTAFTQGGGGFFSYFRIEKGLRRRFEGYGVLNGRNTVLQSIVDDNEIFSLSSSRQRVSNTQISRILLCNVDIENRALDLSLEAGRNAQREVPATSRRCHALMHA